MAEPTPTEPVTPETAKPADVEVIHTQPSVRVLLTWTPTQIRSAESSAVSGYISHAAELVDNLLADESIGGAIETRTGGLQGLPLSFEDGRGDESGESPLAGDLTDDWWRSYPETMLKQLAAWGIVLGVAFAEQVWGINEDGRFAPTLKFWHPKHFTWDTTIDRWVVTTEDEGQVVIEPGDPKWLIYTPYGADRPWARGLWRGLSRWWMLKSYAISDWGLHGEQASRLVITSGTNPQMASPTHKQRESMSADLQDLGKDGVIALPNGFEVDLLEATANTRDIYGAQIEASNNGFVIAINGQNLTTSVKGGSLAAANVHERVEARRLRSDGETLSATVRSASLVYWTAWNYGTSAVAPWPSWETDPPEDLANKAEVFDTVAAALVKLKASGHEVIDIAEMSQDFGIPEIQQVEVEDEPEEVADGSDGDGTSPDDGDDSGDDGDGSPGGDDGDGGSSTAQARVDGPTARLASGELLAQALGFIEGQSYADRLTDEGVKAQARDNRGPDGFVARMSVALDEEDYGAIRAAVLDTYRNELEPEEMSEIIESLFIMAQRAGHVAVDQDV